MAALNQYLLFPYQTVSGAGATNGAALETGPDDGRLIATLDLQQLSGTAPTVDVKLQHSPDGKVWYDLGTPFAQLATVGSETKVFTDFHAYVRGVATLGGTAPVASFVLVASARRAA